jgi:Spy/CpxP family protein refolding chaperone
MSENAIVEAVRDEAAAVAGRVAETVAENAAEDEDGTEWLEERLRAQESLTQQLLTEQRESRSQLTQIMDRLMNLMESQARAIVERQPPPVEVIVEPPTSSPEALEAVPIVAATVPESAGVQEEAPILESRPRRRHRI